MTETTTTKTPEGIRILALRGGLTVPLYVAKLDHTGVGRNEVLDRGQEAEVIAEWVELHADSPSFVRADDPVADEHRHAILLERREVEEAAAQERRRQSARYGKPSALQDSKEFQDALSASLEAELKALGIGATD